jgi:hypothetical protein
MAIYLPLRVDDYDNSRNHGIPPFHASLFLMAAVVLSAIRVEEIKTMFSFPNNQSIGSIQELGRKGVRLASSSVQNATKGS